ncbi:hypothetical protein G4H71_11305 [Rhodococcus triatomae]|uniref:Uncharacterized protein n=1 Tax=Rhodococcus triatomae TaxID=300028 RepID=A0A1G8L9N1_9NOCA|nr:hypothetical protein [Rhodococcus triatomae]QNG20538.1 hypothetical protein G4H72_19075 [Rhodococcus triatomae]QNG23544.1 hypothetical protein G4H71_11305 [Rhodococcus triatomae]SDI52227.1 hypothetical protein SAMN05444695_108102 [Rhodococcus triatomae]
MSSAQRALSPLRRGAAALSVAALLTGGLAVGSGVAAADTACGTSATRVQNGAAGLVGIQLTKEVLGDGTVAPGGTVTYRTTVSTARGVPPLLRGIADYSPPGFVVESATVNGSAVTPAVNVDTRKASVSSGLGWLINGSNRAVFEITYRVPANAQVGTVHDSGAAMTPDLWGEQTWNPIGVCTTIRGKNAGEAVVGSVEGAGFGSSGPIANGSSGSSIINDPSGFIADIITQVIRNGS